MTGQLSLDDLSSPRGLTRAELMTAQEVAELLDVPVSTVREWGRNGTLPRVKLGRHVRFVRSHVEAAILAAEHGRVSVNPGLRHEGAFARSQR
jgi:excisionase family DNA binding protein